MVTNANHSSWLKRDIVFFTFLILVGAAYLGLIASMLLTDAVVASARMEKAFATIGSPDIRHAIYLSIVTSIISTALSLIFGLPIAYALSRHEFRGKAIVEFLCDIPIFLPPLVVGLSLFVLLRYTPLKWLDDNIGFSFAVPGIILAQTTISTALVINTVRATFDSISPRAEQIALTLGCRTREAFWHVLIPSAWRGILVATTLSWARAFGEFGPILVLVGSTRMKTLVLPTSIHLEFSSGNFEGALGISLLMVFIALTVLVSVRLIVRKGVR